jgi:hypothetical protein
MPRAARGALDRASDRPDLPLIAGDRRRTAVPEALA